MTTFHTNYVEWNFPYNQPYNSCVRMDKMRTKWIIKCSPLRQSMYFNKNFLNKKFPQKWDVHCFFIKWYYKDDNVWICLHGHSTWEDIHFLNYFEILILCIEWTYPRCHVIVTLFQARHLITLQRIRRYCMFFCCTFKYNAVYNWFEERCTFVR